MYSKTKLANGLSLILAPLKETKAVTVLILLPVGSRYEHQKINGVSHFIEHLMFKGTSKRPTSLDLTKELDAVGAEYNAFTAKDHTGYYVKLATENIELAFDILSDMIFHSVFRSEEIDKERGVILEEINMYEDNPMIHVQSIFEQTIYPNQPLGWQISGPREVIKEISRDDILEYKEKFYQPDNIVLTIAGNFKSKQVITLAKKYFGQKSSAKVESLFKPIKINQSKPQIGLMTKETEQVQTCLGVLGYSLADKKMYPLYLLAVILGGNMSSRLFASVREEKGLAYYIRTDISAYRDIGTFLVQSGLDKKRIKEAITLILAELKKISDFGVTEKELVSAKNYLKGKLVLDLEDSESVADWFGKQELLLDKILRPEEKIKKIFAVKKSDVQAVAKELFKTNNLNLAMIGPFSEANEFISLLKF
ncbi:MAG: pitrilysin family protein [Candidatus Buchananbacteria bacterium]